MIMGLLVVGFISYGGEIHDTIKKSKSTSLTWTDVLFDTSICLKQQNRKSFWHYFKIGLGVKI